MGLCLFGGVSFTALGYFILIKGVGKSPFISDEVRGWIDMNMSLILLGIFLGTAVLSYILNALKINVLRIIVLTGTFALAMAFAGNDLMNLIGVPLAALDSLIDFLAHGNGDSAAFMMTSLEESAKSPLVYLLLAGEIIIMAMVTSKKAQNVVKTSVDLSRQDEGEEMFGSSRVARSIVRFFQSFSEIASAYIPRKMRTWVDSRFDKEEATLAEGAAFDEVRAAVNLVLAALLIIIGTTFKLPLSTTYVTFMVAMGASLADRAWSRESAVFRITGVLSVIGGWFVTAGVAFAAAATVCVIMYYGGFIAMFAFMAIAVYLLWRSNVGYKEKKDSEEVETARTMLRSKDRFETWRLLREHFADFQAKVLSHMADDYKLLVKAMENNDLRALRTIRKRIKEATVAYKRNRRMELLALRRVPMDMAIERNTWFHLAQNADSQYIYCLTRILDPVIEHVDNGFAPIPSTYMSEYAQVLQRVEVLLTNSHTMMQSRNYREYYNIMDIADSLKDELSGLRKMHIDRMQSAQNINLTTSQLYLNLLQETQELLSIMRHQLRATKNFTA